MCRTPSNEFGNNLLGGVFMTIEEAILILNPETSAKTIWDYEDSGISGKQVVEKINEACKLACKHMEVGAKKTKNTLDNLHWNVYYEDFNYREIRSFNIFTHHGFVNDLKEILESDLFYDEFCEKLRRVLMYHFWAKAEYEVYITTIIGKSEDVMKKEDIYGQIMINFDHFCKYVWNTAKGEK